MAKSKALTKAEVTLFPDEESPLYWANLTATEKIVINQGGTWSSKSYSILQVLFTIAIIRAGYIITVISNTVTKLKEDAIRISKEIVAKNPEVKRQLLPGALGYNSTDRTYNFLNGSLIEFKSFEDAEQAKGGKRHILYINEATRIPYMIFFEADLRTSVRTFIDYNPTSQFWAHDNVINNKKEFPYVKVIRSWHIHNRHISQEQHDRIERIQDKDLHKVYARGLTGKLRGTVYNNWVEVPEFSWQDGVIWYLDFGFSEKETADPTAGGRIIVNPANLELDFVADELIYSQAVPASAIAQIFFEAGYKRGQPCYCDHSDEMIRELRLLKIAAFPAAKGPGSILSGVLFLKSKRMGYTARSANIKEELKRYKFLEIEGHVTNTPVDEWNHHMDGIRYGAHTHSLRTGKV
jgi:phage terminase large subunit